MSSIAIAHSGAAAQLNAQVATAQVFPLISNPNLPATVYAKGKNVLEQRQFRVRAEGNAQTAGAYTLKASLLAGLTIPANPLVATNWITLGSGTARSIATGWAPWWIEANLIFDSYSGNLQGTFNQMVNNLYDALAPLAAPVTGINGTNITISQAGTPVPPSDPVVWFAVALTFGTAGANVGNLMNLELGF